MVYGQIQSKQISDPAWSKSVKLMKNPRDCDKECVLPAGRLSLIGWPFAQIQSSLQGDKIQFQLYRYNSRDLLSVTPDDLLACPL